MRVSLAHVRHAIGTPVRVMRARRLVRRGGLVSLTIDGPVVTMPETIPWWRRQTARSTALESVRELVTFVVNDPKVAGMVVELRSVRAGAAQATSLRGILARVPAAGKSLVVYLPMGASSREVLIASAADRVIVGPESSISPLGIAVESHYYRRALDKIGVLPEIFARGEFKTAGESLARDSMSDEQRQQLGAILDVMEDELLSGLSEGRRLSRDEARRVLDGGPYRASEAVSRRLADAKGYDDELSKLAVPTADTPPPAIPAAPYLALRRRPAGARRVGVVHVRGAIVSRAPFSMGRVAVDERVIGALRRARESRAIAGVVVLIDSPGGSVLASDRIHHEVVRLAEKKPVVACMSNVAASGGYYVASGAHGIVAQTTTITGSIGVVAAHLVLSPLLDKLGIVTELVKRGARADMLSASRPLDQGEREAMERDIDGFYQDFVNVVARGRNRPPDEIEKLARGRVYSGREAARVGLVDRLGDLETAVDWVCERLGEKRPLRAEVVKPPRTMPKPPELPRPFVHALEALAGGTFGDLATLVFASSPAERVLAYDGRPSFLG